MKTVKSSACLFVLFDKHGAPKQRKISMSVCRYLFFVFKSLTGGSGNNQRVTKALRDV